MVIPWSSSSSEDEGDKPDEENEKVKVRPFNRALVEVEEKEYDFDKEEKKESDEEEKGIETPVKRRSIKRKVTKNVVQLSSDEEEDTDIIEQNEMELETLYNKQIRDNEIIYVDLPYKDEILHIAVKLHCQHFPYHKVVGLL